MEDMADSEKSNIRNEVRDEQIYTSMTIYMLCLTL